MLMGDIRGMDQAAICRGRAEEADREAQKAHDPEMKRMYEDIAAAWRKLATFIETTKLDRINPPGG
jgi:hypothetical protein